MHDKRCWGLWLTLVLGLVWHGSLAFGADPVPFTALQLNYFAKPPDLPEISMTDLDDKNVSLRSWQGRVIVLNFWTTW